MPVTARSLADELRSRGEESLVQLLLARPDLARPAPADLTTLAARATTRASVQRALDGLDTAHLQALEVVVALAPVGAGDVARALGAPPRSRRVAGVVDRLCTLALCWRSPEGVRAARTVAEVVGTPAGLGPLAEAVPEGAALEQAVGSLGPAHRAVLDALTWGPPTGVLPSGTSGDRAVVEAGRELLQLGLLHQVDEQHVVLPRQVALALRGGRVHRHPALEPPEPEAGAVATDVVEATAGARAGELLGLAAEVLDVWAETPPRVLRAGGLAVRDLARTADLLELGTDEAAWLLEVLLAAGLVARDDDDPASWRPTVAADEWSASPPQQRWVRLAAAWLSTSAAASLVGQDSGGTRVNALSTATSWPAGRQRRHDALRALAALPPGSAPGADDLMALLRWRHPVRTAHAADRGVEVVQREAEWAAVTGRGALSAAGRALLGHDHDRAADLLLPHLPPPVEHVLLQADLTAVAPGRLDGPARELMRTVARVESRGGATVHRLTEDGVRRALDRGWTADRLLADLAAASSTGVPQPLEYLVRDVARRHGVARVGSVAAYLRSDDPALLDRALADRELGLLRLRRLAPTVVVSPVPAATVLDVLRERGYGPVAEGGDGGVALTAPGTRRAPVPRAAEVQVSRVDAETATRVVRAMRSGESARVPRTSGGLPAPTDPVVTASLLREAAAEGAAVWVAYADEGGGLQRLLMRPAVVEAGRVRGTLPDADVPRTLLLHRISGAALAE